MDFSKLTYSQVTSMADELKNSAAQMETNLNEIKALFNQVGTDEVWSGTSASTAKETFDTLSAKFPEFSQAINDCYVYLTSVVQNYQEVDQMVSGK